MDSRIGVYLNSMSSQDISKLKLYRFNVERVFGSKSVSHGISCEVYFKKSGWTFVFVMKNARIVMVKTAAIFVTKSVLRVLEVLDVLELLEVLKVLNVSTSLLDGSSVAFMLHV